MSISMALFSPHASLSPYSSSHSVVTHKPLFTLRPKRSSFVISAAASDGNGGAGVAVSVAEEQPKAEAANGPVAAASASAVETEEEAAVVLNSFKDPRWVNGTWELKQFEKDGKTDWDAVIDAEARRRKWLEDNPESSSNDDPVVFDTSIIPWWAWMKRFHLPEAELLNGRAAMIGFFMAYFVDSLTGVGLVDQMGNFFCKTLLFIAVLGVLLIRKNEDIETLKKLIEETTFYDKQWQATWQDETKKD
ncbi:light-harvesting complex-like protein 3 isotype 2, chloroplastic [Punica granatum]|uniref:Uncharacterized protein n=2 Tax=Punica granatum TaxID=22663 RepID=A0A218XTG2_PUNGR|nr:light-harvesting complex-like protein 3 isotype 2, chloroplastic [Punica granatum]OWM88327.1 hypothetical protein CDL15_Pgr003739 [Punica granatum]PKI38126.1 hypothetical protein CRG98_041491 [Punica granatum]